MSERPSAGPVVVRTGRSEDVATVLRFWTQATSVASSTDDPESVSALLARDPEALMVAELDGRVVGTLIVGWDGWRAGLYRLAVDPSLRRSGIGGSLVREAERRLSELGARRVAAVVIGEHDHAVGFCRAMGYEHDVRVGRFVRDLPAE
jgi:ribosomal protein S18 acetylase RimI-like enzyme